MGTHAKHSDDPRPTNTAHTASALPPHRSSSCPPETPPLIDPANFRYPRLTPNFKDFPQSWNPPFHDSTAPSTDIFASPDPTAMYNSMALPPPSPLFKEWYPSQSPMIGTVPPYLNGETAENRAQRQEKLSVVEEMNGLFANLPQVEPENRSDNNFDGAASNISSPEHEELINESRIKLECMADQTQTIATSNAAISKSRYQTSQSSSETRHLLDTSSVSPSCSPQLTETRIMKKAAKSRRNGKGTTGASKKSSHKSEKAKRPPTRPPAAMKSQPKLTAQIPADAASTPFAAANAFAMNPALAGMFPFPGSLAAAGMSHMYPGAGAMFFQGRPMAFVAGARGPELIPIDMLAQASAVQYGAAAQALQASGQMKNMAGANGVMSQTPYESAGNSRKKRRRQMLERSGCSEEQARENRARALKRLRQKKTVRSQSSTVRYACRKRIAMVRPRVNGRFATKEEVEQTQHEEALLKE